MTPLEKTEVTCSANDPISCFRERRGFPRRPEPEASPRHRALRCPDRHLAGAILLAACLATGIAMAADPAVVSTQRDENAATVAKPRPGDSPEQKWGIQVSGLFLSAGGNMVDFRYKVLDPAKAAFLTKPETKPELLNVATGTKLIVPDTPTVGQLRQTARQPMAGKLYFILFANTRHHVKSGDKVTITAGDFKVENLVVE